MIIKNLPILVFKKIPKSIEKGNDKRNLVIVVFKNHILKPPKKEIITRNFPVIICKNLSQT